MTLGYDRPLYMLAFDHRGSFTKALFGIEGRPSAEEAARVVDAKTLIFEGFLEALARGASVEPAGILVDEEFGSGVARRAASAGITLAIPVEKSGQDEFDFEFGEAFREHIEAFDPTFAKVLVRYNPEGDRALNARQAERLAVLSDWLHASNRKFLFELLVPATETQLADAGDARTYDLEVRPGLMVAAIAELQEAGVEPDVWKVEGLDRRRDCARVVEQARTGGRDDVSCIVLGRGADARRVDAWLREGASVPGFIGFAIGRTMWWDALVAFRDGTIGRAEAAEQIAERYLHAVRVYDRAAEAA